MQNHRHAESDNEPPSDVVGQTVDMAPPVDPSLIEFASQIAREAGALTLQHFRSRTLDVERKSDGSPVTVADRGAERLLRDAISAAHPDDAIEGEEFPNTSGSSGRRWVVDPIDGTQAFTRGVDLYTNLVYFEDEHGPAVGVINVPALDEIVVAGRGRGCTWNGEPCRVSDRTESKGAVLSTSGFDYWDADRLGRVHSTDMAMRTWGDGYGYVLVATGRIEAMVDPIVQFYDIAPCSVILPEAGGRVSTFSGNPSLVDTTCLGSNGHLHDEILGVLTGDASS